MINKGLLLLWLIMGTVVSIAQPCTGTIATYPYVQGFEANDGGWIPGGTSSDWEWGTPTKPVITTAGTGARCWVTGTLTGGAYNNSENSFLVSPCFNFSTLQYPEIRFKLFWETERRFDGASFEYSIDGGGSWTTLGDANSNNNCNGSNWFNAGSINFLSNRPGWSGNSQANSGSCLGGEGSGGWLTARHTLRLIAGQTNVRFRFTFGAGTTCNAYDGFAIDDIEISEAPIDNASFNFVCGTAARSVNFTAVGNCINSYAWNFGDPTSGSSNTATSSNPVHVFSVAGTYTVSLTTGFVNSAPVTVTNQVTILGTNTLTVWPGACTGASDATLSVVASGSNTGYFYNWNTTPAQSTSSISNVGPGNYTVIVSALNACNSIANFTLSANPLQLNTTVQNETCNNANGAIFTTVTGGNAPYRFLWSNGSSSANLQNIAAGNYTVNITDVNGCSLRSSNITISNTNSNVLVNLGADRSICPGQTIVLNAGLFSSYLWQDNSRNQTLPINSAGLYRVTVTDSLGCAGTDEVLVTEDCSGIYFPSAFTPNNDGRNDFFGPLGNLSALSNFKLSVYNRYGQQIFFSNNPFQKWDGQWSGKAADSNNFVWMASFDLNGISQQMKGTVILIQ